MSDKEHNGTYLSKRGDNHVFGVPAVQIHDNKRHESECYEQLRLLVLMLIQEAVSGLHVCKESSRTEQRNRIEINMEDFGWLKQARRQSTAVNVKRFIMISLA